LPNVYMFQAELQNTGSTLLADYHNNALTLGGKVDWFQMVWITALDGSPNEKGHEESTEGEYYQLYSAKLQELLAGGSLDGITGVANNKNLAILHSDMAIANESHLDIVIPFYNKIVIEDLSNSTTGIKSGGNAPVSILQTLATGDNTKDFIDLLQMRTIQSVLAGGNLSIDFRRTLKTINPNFGLRRRRNPDVQYDTKVAANYALYNLETVMGEMSSLAGAAVHIPFYKSINSTHTSVNFSLLRDFSRSDSDFEADYGAAVDDADIDLFPNPYFPLITTNAPVSSVTRTFKQVLDGVKCHTETLMYVIEKRRILPDGTRGPIQQRFFISNRFGNTNPIVYCDSQVKYGQRYRYDIKKIALVFGNEYSYDPDWGNG